MQVTHKTGLESDDYNMMEGLYRLWCRYIVYWPFFLFLIAMSLAGGWLYLRYYTVPLYDSNAKILIKDERKGAEDPKTIESLNLLTTKKIVENEIEVISSRTLLNEVVKKLYLYAPVFQKGSVRSLSAYTTCPVKVEVKDIADIKESGPILFHFDVNTSEVIINNERYPLNQWLYTPFGTLKFHPNSRNSPVKANTTYYFVLINPKDITPDMQGRLTVTSASKLASIINLSYKDEVPQRGEDILNELIASYNDAIIRDKNSLAANTLSFVEDRLTRVEHDLDSIEHRIQKYKTNSGAVDISTQGQLFLRNVSDNDQKLSEINMQLAVLNQVESYVYSKNNSGGVVPSTLGVNDPVLTQLLDKLYVTELQYEKLKGTTAENNPLLVSITDQIEKIKPGILENIQNQRKSLEASKTNLTSTNGIYTSMLQTLPQKERELIDINRQQLIKNDIYNFLLKKREETALSFASTVSDSRVIDRAESSDIPVSPNNKVIYLISLTAALALGLGIITAKETLNTKILFRKEIEEATINPVIAEIAIDKKGNPIVTGENKKTFIAEQFRRLRMALNYMGISSRKKKILVTSTIEGEGKSFVATNLAISLALTGKKVVLLELDLINPSVSSTLNVKGSAGITDYLVGKLSPEEIIKTTAVNENLFVIPAGRVTENSSELLMNGKVQSLLAYLDTMFDFILIDAAPVSPVTDAYILSPLCDTTLYIVRHRYTPKMFVQRMDENNKINTLNNVAIVFNGVYPRGFFRNNYGFGYGYGYMYKEKTTRSPLPLTAKA